MTDHDQDIVKHKVSTLKKRQNNSPVTTEINNDSALKTGSNISQSRIER